MSVGWVAAGASLVSGFMGAEASEDAANAQAASADRSAALQKETADKQIALQREQFDKQVSLQEPFRQTGLAAQNRLSMLLGITPDQAGQIEMDRIKQRLRPQFTRELAPGVMNYDDYGLDKAARAEYMKMPESREFGSLTRDFSMDDFQADPGYAFRQAEGFKGLERAGSAGGRLQSGRAGKDFMRFGQDLASQEYGNAFNRFQVNRSNKLNPLQSLAGVGQTATNAIGQAGQNYASGASGALGAYGANAGSAMIGAGNARASGYVGGANALSGGVSGGIGAYQNQQFLNRLNRPQSYAAPGGFDGGGYGAGINPYSGEYMGSLEF